MSSVCGDDGGVARETVLAVLRAARVSAAATNDDPALVRISYADGSIEVQAFPDKIHRRMLQRIAVKCRVEVAWFYHPEMVPPRPLQLAGPDNDLTPDDALS